MAPDLAQVIEAWDGEQVVVRCDRPSGAWMFVCIHSRKLGPAAGGTRMKVYSSPAEALHDGTRLAAGMTAKFAVAGLPFGGGKAVLAVPRLPEGEERRELLHRYGQLLCSLGGSYLTGCDMNTTPADLDTILDVCPHVFGNSAGSGEPGPFTARGVFHGIRASVAHATGSSGLEGRTVVVQGVGSVGARLAQALVEAGARVLLADVDADRAAALAATLGVETIPAADVLAAECGLRAVRDRGHADRGDDPPAPLPDRGRSREQPARRARRRRPASRGGHPLRARLRDQRGAASSTTSAASRWAGAMPRSSRRSRASAARSPRSSGAATRKGSRPAAPPTTSSPRVSRRLTAPTKEALVATQTVRLTRDQLAALPDSYFKAVDAKDVDGILSHFADDATLTVQTDHAVFTGADEIRRMFTDFCDNSVSIFHEIKNIVVEPDAGKVATEQSYIGELVDGTKNDMHNCNFFDVDAEGKFTRVIIWMAGTNPLK